MFPWIPSNLNFPFSGDVNQRIEPDWFFGTINSEVGDGEIEREIFLNVASYGKQIGLITDVLLCIANELKITSDNNRTLSNLKKIQAEVEKIKNSKQERVKENAKKILYKLKSINHEEFNSLIMEFQKER